MGKIPLAFKILVVIPTFSVLLLHNIVGVLKHDKMSWINK
jgi:hypothetical protein